MPKEPTERRKARLLEVLSHRQPDLTLVLANIHDPHNVSAIYRSCDAFGVSQVMMASGVPYKKGDHVTIVSGDLKDFEGEIIGFNFHKRKAMIRSEMLGNSVIHVGIEIVQKQDEEKQ